MFKLCCLHLFITHAFLCSNDMSNVLVLHNTHFVIYLYLCCDEISFFALFFALLCVIKAFVILKRRSLCDRIKSFVFRQSYTTKLFVRLSFYSWEGNIANCILILSCKRSFSLLSHNNPKFFFVDETLLDLRISTWLYKFFYVSALVSGIDHEPE